MDPHSFQLSHEELLLLLGLLGLPTPLALGPRPTEGYDQIGLGIALAAATGSLLARELVQLDTEALYPPEPVRPLAELARSVALADSCLVLVERRANERQVAHLTSCEGLVVLHTSPLPRTHRLMLLGSHAEATAWLVATLDAHPEQPRPVVTVGVDVLATTLDAIDRGDVAIAHRSLMTSGLESDLASQFLYAVGPQPARFAFGAMRGMTTGLPPQVCGAVALVGTSGTWWSPSDGSSTTLTLHPVDGTRLRNELAAMTTWLQPVA
ncbi:hypothetical protein EYB53_008970 [Candidatus Chloroploca sp. M-50]|uniref:ESX secretion-associated protein EspG n=1 Tax=Candidatus Chloroploca mongolica TaxID=2528176 RepID=A0ABS4D8U5_9CHLR|nr:hypothetical protein [Candidatus Chloroploca mongolica]MBP1465834.1 hypothetical protein [Candidatus Chloroploca mongolica]